MQTERKPLLEILERLHEQAQDDIEAWAEDRWYGTKVLPPDLIAALDHINEVSERAIETKSPMRQLLQIATTLSVSEETEKAVIGGVLLQCHEEINHLVQSSNKLETKEVDYPLQTPKDAEETP